MSESPLTSISMRFLAAAGVVVLGLAACVDPDEFSEGVEKREREREADYAEDVELLGCEPSGNGWMAAQIQVTNQSTERSNYYVEVVFTSEDKATQFDTGSASVNALAPGQTASDEAATFSDPPGPYVCEVVDITRYSDE